MKYMQRILLLISIAFIAAASWAASKHVLEHISIESLLFLRFLVAFIVILPLYSILKWKSWKNIATLILISSWMWLSSVFYIAGIRTTNLWVAQALFLLTPILTLIASYWFLSERIQSKKILGILISILGTSIIFFLPKIYNQVDINVWDIWGNIYILLGAMSYVSYIIFMKKTKFTPMEFMIGGIIGGAILGGYLGISDILQTGNPYKHLTLSDFFLIISIGSIWTVYLYFLVQKLMKISSAFFTSFGTYIQLIFSTLFWYFFFDEYIGVGFLLGSILTVYWVYYVSRIK